jgi:hypothetical protein
VRGHAATFVPSGARPSQALFAGPEDAAEAAQDIGGDVAQGIGGDVAGPLLALVIGIGPLRAACHLRSA